MLRKVLHFHRANVIFSRMFHGWEVMAHISIYCAGRICPLMQAHFKSWTAIVVFLEIRGSIIYFWPTLERWLRLQKRWVIYDPTYAGLAIGNYIVGCLRLFQLASKTEISFLSKKIPSKSRQRWYFAWSRRSRHVAQTSFSVDQILQMGVIKRWGTGKRNIWQQIKIPIKSGI